MKEVTLKLRSPDDLGVLMQVCRGLGVSPRVRQSASGAVYLTMDEVSYAKLVAKIKIKDPAAGASDQAEKVQRETENLIRNPGILTVEEQQASMNRAAKATTQDAKPRKARAKLGRVNQVKTRLTDEELKTFEKRVEESKMPQGDFMRECLLRTEISVRALTETDKDALQTMMRMSSDLNRIGGLMKGTLKQNQDEFAVLSEQDKLMLKENIRELNALSERIQKVVQELYGNP